MQMEEKQQNITSGNIEKAMDNETNEIEQLTEVQPPEETPEEIPETTLEETPEETPEENELNIQNEKLKSELAELQDKYLRLYSEFENYRRRTNKEKIEMIDFASEKIIIEILPVLDDFERAMQMMKETQNTDNTYQGINLIIAKLRKILNDRGLEEMDCINKEFNPDLHEAITKIPAPNKKMKGKIVDQIQKGYLLKGKVIRHAKVVVGE